LIAHGISLLVLCLVVAGGVAFLYVGGPPAEISARRDEGKPITTVRTILTVAVGRSS
jgi:hypothetical protein